MVVTSTLLDRLASLGRDLGRLLGAFRPDATDPGQIDEWYRAARTASEDGRHTAAIDLFRQILSRRPGDPVALRGWREAAQADGRPEEAIGAQRRLVAAVSPADRPEEMHRLAGLYYDLGLAELDRGRLEPAARNLKNALRARGDFVPAALALGDAQLTLGDPREAVRTWERALERQPSLPVLERLERTYRDEGRPSRMIALYRRAAEQAPDDLSLAVALGRVYLELEMLDEAAEQLERVEVKAPEVAVVHAYLAMVFEHRGEWRDACAEYRRAIGLGRVLEWPHRCTGCGAVTAGWRDRCPFCRRWNSLRATRSP